MKSRWQTVLDYFNSKVSNKIFTRAEVMSFFGCIYAPRRIETIQSYMNTLKRAGYISYIEPGVYRKLKKIPNISEYQMKLGIKKASR